MPRLLYRRGQELVAVRFTKLDPQRTLFPGDPVPKDLREFHRRSLFRRGAVALAKDPWAKKRVEALKAKEKSAREAAEAEAKAKTGNAGGAGRKE